MKMFMLFSSWFTDADAAAAASVYTDFCTVFLLDPYLK